MVVVAAGVVGTIVVGFGVGGMVVVAAGVVGTRVVGTGVGGIVVVAAGVVGTFVVGTTVVGTLVVGSGVAGVNVVDGVADVGVMEVEDVGVLGVGVTGDSLPVGMAVGWTEAIGVEVFPSSVLPGWLGLTRPITGGVTSMLGVGDDRASSRASSSNI